MKFELCYHINSILNNKEYDRNRIVLLKRKKRIRMQSMQTLYKYFLLFLHLALGFNIGCYCICRTLLFISAQSFRNGNISTLINLSYQIKHGHLPETLGLTSSKDHYRIQQTISCE